MIIMKKNHKNICKNALCSAAILSIAGCGNNDKKEWENSYGTQGKINLNAVKAAFQKHPDLPGFEKRLNEIFEGDNLIIVDAKRVPDGFSMSGFEDLDKDKKVIAGKDDLLFTLTVAKGTCTLKGEGGNSYYNESWRYDVNQARSHYNSRRHSTIPYFFMWYSMRSWRGSYYTPHSRYDSMSSSRRSYRATSGFKSQVSANSGFEKKMQSTHTSNYSAAKPTPTRSNYVLKTKSSPTFASTLSKSKSSSGWGKRSASSSRSRSSFGSSGGFRSSSGGAV